MPASASAKRYAAAAFNVASEADDYDGWLSSLNEFARILRMPSARTVFLSPVVPMSQKHAALDRLLSAAPPLVRNFLHILADRARLDEVPGIAEALHALINQRRGIITAEVTTAIPLDADMEQLVAQRLAAHLNRDPKLITIRSRIDPAIIGGVVARVGDQVIDDSVRGRLERLRRSLYGRTH
ncbi:MAG TPA: F0F1 ATP synthase subunit delta [Chloroflexota bacterium]|nr:F0F1 ATP synthase subunit delta [Chloroflexota bacterium]